MTMYTGHPNCRPSAMPIVVAQPLVTRLLSLGLLEVIDGLGRRGVAFRSLGDPIDTTSPQGRFTLQTVTAERA